MQSFMAALLYRGARPIGKVKRGVDIHGAISPIQMPGLIPSACYAWTTDLPFGIYPYSRAEVSQDQLGESGESVAPIQNQFNQVISEHKLNTLSRQSQSESGPGLTPMPKSVEMTQLKQSIGADNTPVTTQINTPVINQINPPVTAQSNTTVTTQSRSDKAGKPDMGPLPREGEKSISEEEPPHADWKGSGQNKSESGPGLTPMPKSVEMTQLKQSIGADNTPVTTQITPVTTRSRSDKAGKPDIGPLPRVNSFPRGEGRSISESIPSIEGVKGRMEDAEKVIHFSKPLDLTQSFIKAQIHKSQALIHAASSHPTGKGSNRASIASVPHRSYQEDKSSKTRISQLSPANKGLAAPLARPSESAKDTQRFQEILHPQGKGIPLPGSIINQIPSHRSENIHKLKINRLNIQVINQKPPAPSQQAPRVQMPSVSPDSGEVLDRYYLKYFF